MCEDELKTKLAESIFTLFSQDEIPYCDGVSELAFELISIKDVGNLVVDIWNYGFEPPIEFEDFLEFGDYTDDLTGSCFSLEMWNHIFGISEFGLVPKLYNISKACNDILENPSGTRYRVDINTLKGIKGLFDENKNDALKQLADWIFSNVCQGNAASDADEIAYFTAEDNPDAVENAFGNNPYGIYEALDSFVKTYRYKEPITGVSDTFAGWWTTFHNDDSTGFVEELYKNTLTQISTVIKLEISAGHIRFEHEDLAAPTRNAE